MSAVRRSAPPAQSIELRRWELTSGDELRVLRRELQAALRAHDLAAPDRSPVTEQAVLVVTELASNALRHGRPPAVVRLLEADGCFILEVADGDVSSAPQLAAARHVDDGGRGLHIARSLALEVCWYTTERAKHIWAAFPAETSRPQTPAGPVDAGPVDAGPVDAGPADAGQPKGSGGRSVQGAAQSEGPAVSDGPAAPVPRQSPAEAVRCDGPKDVG